MDPAIVELDVFTSPFSQVSEDLGRKNRVSFRMCVYFLFTFFSGGVMLKVSTSSPGFSLLAPESFFPSHNSSMLFAP